MNTKNQDNSIVLACASDKNYAFPLAVMLRSVVKNLSREWSLKVNILDGGILPWQRFMIRAALGNRGKINWRTANIDDFKHLKIRGHMTVATLFRLLLPDLLVKEKKLIYLDCDLVVEADIVDLWNIPVKNIPALAVQGFGAPYVSDPYGVPTWKEQGMSADTPCLNAGVMVMNLDYWREHSIAEKVINYLQNRRDNLKLNDQLGINATLAGNWYKLDPRWNQTHPIWKYDEWPDSTFKESLRPILHELKHHPFIVHYTSARKPWDVYCEHPLAGRFKHYANSMFALRVWFAMRKFNERLNSFFMRVKKRIGSH